MFTSFSGRRWLRFGNVDFDFHIDEKNLRVRAEQLRTRMSMYASLIFSQMVLQPLFVWMYWEHASHQMLLYWFVLFYALHALELTQWALHKEELNSLQECRAWHVRFVAFSFTVGLMWGGAAVVFFPADIIEQSILICVMLGLVAGAVTMNPIHPPSLYSYVLSIMIPLIVRVSFAHDMHHWILALMLFMFVTVILFAGQGLNKNFILSIKQRFENLSLLQQLTAQKAETEEARNQLEKANVVLNQTLQELQAVNASLELRVAEQTQQNIEKERLLVQQSRSAAMGEMIRNIAHQWRQPLNTVGLVVQNIREDFRGDRLNKEGLEKDVETALQCITSMSKTIDDFRNFFRADKLKVLFNLHHAVVEPLQLLEASLKNNDIKVSLSGDRELQVFGYASEFSQAILNLLSNATDALVGNKVHHGSIEIELMATEYSGGVVIRDNAGGVAEDAMAKIFQPYFSTKINGSGIGLYMSKIIVEKHMGGSITYRNTAEGAEFTVSIPLRPRDDTKLG